MANKKQRALELAKTEASISGIPKGGSTRTGTTPAEELAYGLAGTGISAGMIGSSVKGMAKLYKLYKAEKKASKTSKVSNKKLLELYQKAHPGAKVSKKPAKNKISKKAVIAHGTGAALAATAAISSPNQLSKRTSGKAKGSSVKKYSSGGGVRAARF